MEILKTVDGFLWDNGNKEKNWIKYQVRPVECEMVFFNQPLIVFDDEKYSKSESRYYAFGKTDIGRKLLIVFCVRKNKIRVISARDMNRNERKFYDDQEKDDSKI